MLLHCSAAATRGTSAIEEASSVEGYLGSLPQCRRAPSPSGRLRCSAPRRLRGGGLRPGKSDLAGLGSSSSGRNRTVRYRASEAAKRKRPTTGQAAASDLITVVIG